MSDKKLKPKIKTNNDSLTINKPKQIDSMFVPKKYELLDKKLNNPVRSEIKPESDTLNDLYEYKNSHPWLNIGYDVVNAGLYFFPATAPIAMGMTALSAAGAANNLRYKGLTLDNGMDLVGAVPGFGVAERIAKGTSKTLLKKSGKTLRYFNRMNKYVPDKNVLGSPSLLQTAFKNNVYSNPARLIVGEDVLNKGLGAFDIIRDIKELK